MAVRSASGRDCRDPGLDTHYFARWPLGLNLIKGVFVGRLVGLVGIIVLSYHACPDEWALILKETGACNRRSLLLRLAFVSPAPSGASSFLPNPS
ncbi:hypothetical protein THAOC_18910, partial [Thalassiosira oceanica]